MNITPETQAALQRYADLLGQDYESYEISKPVNDTRYLVVIVFVDGRLVECFSVHTDFGFSICAEVAREVVRQASLTNYEPHWHVTLFDSREDAPGSGIVTLFSSAGRYPMPRPLGWNVRTRVPA